MVGTAYKWKCHVFSDDEEIGWFYNHTRERVPIDVSSDRGGLLMEECGYCNPRERKYA